MGLGEEFTERDAVCVLAGGRAHRLDLTRPIRSGLATKALTWPEKFKALKLAATQQRSSLGDDSYEMLGGIDTETSDDYCNRVLGSTLRD